MFDGAYNTDNLVFPYRMRFKTILCEDEPYKIEESANSLMYTYKDIENDI